MTHLLNTNYKSSGLLKSKSKILRNQNFLLTEKFSKHQFKNKINSSLENKKSQSNTRSPHYEKINVNINSRQSDKINSYSKNKTENLKDVFYQMRKNSYEFNSKILDKSSTNNFSGNSNIRQSHPSSFLSKDYSITSSSKSSTPIHQSRVYSSLPKRPSSYQSLTQNERIQKVDKSQPMKMQKEVDFNYKRNSNLFGNQDNNLIEYQRNKLSNREYLGIDNSNFSNENSKLISNEEHKFNTNRELSPLYSYLNNRLYLDNSFSLDSNRSNSYHEDTYYDSSRSPITQLQSKLYKQAELINDLKLECKILKSDKEELQKKNIYCEENLNHLQLINSQLESEKLVKFNNFSELNKQLENKKSQTRIDQIEKDYQLKYNNLNEELTLKLNQLEHKCSKLQHKNNRLKSENSKSVIIQLQSELDWQAKSMNDLKLDKENLQKKYDDCKGNLQRCNAKLESEIQLKFNINKTDCENCFKLNKQLENKKLEIINIDHIEKDYQFKLNQLEDKCSKLQHENNRLKSYKSEISQIEILQNNYDKCQLKLSRSDKEIQNWQQKFSQVEIHNENLTYYYNKHLSEIKDLRTSFNQLNEFNYNLLNECDKFKLQLKCAEEKNKNLQSDLNARNMENDKLNQQIMKDKIHLNSIKKSENQLNQIRSEPKIIINHSDEHNKHFLSERENQTSEFSNTANDYMKSNTKNPTPSIDKQNSNKEASKKRSSSRSTPITSDRENNLHRKDYNDSWEPIGFENPKGFCFLNCIIQQLYSCTEFRQELISYHKNDCIATKESTSEASDEDKIFVNNFCKLMEEIQNRNEKKIKEFVSKIQNYFIHSSSGDDVLKCFMGILTVLLKVTKVKNKLNRNQTISSGNSEISFKKFKEFNDGFVFKLFYGQMRIRLKCAKCKHIFNENYQLFKSIALPVPESKTPMKLNYIINKFLEKSSVISDDKRNCRCLDGSKDFYSSTKYTHMPKYLFIYLNRGSFYELGTKINTHVKSKMILDIPMKNTWYKYKLLSVIDHIGDNYGGHYYAKSCFESNRWWMLNDSRVYSISNECNEIVTENTVVFLFKKIPENNS